MGPLKGWREADHLLLTVKTVASYNICKPLNDPENERLQEMHETVDLYVITYLLSETREKWYNPLNVCSCYKIQQRGSCIYLCATISDQTNTMAGFLPPFWPELQVCATARKAQQQWKRLIH